MLQAFRRESGFWDVAFVAILLNTMLQIGSCLSFAQDASDRALSDPANWCSVHARLAVNDAASGDPARHADECSDCLQCIGFGLAVLAVGAQAIGTYHTPGNTSVVQHGTALLSHTAEIYQGRAPPKTLPL